MSYAHQAESPSDHSALPALARGTACLPCRRRKMRCDGMKPACGQCISKGREEDCEYTGDTQGLTRTQLLEENISLLEARIRELENPSESTSVKLHNPKGNVIAPSGSPPALVPSGLVSNASRAPSVGTAGVDATPNITPQDIHAMITDFLPFASQLGFFLNIPRFTRTLQPALSDPLLTAACLWGAHLTRTPRLRAHTPALLATALHGVSASLFLSTPRRGARAVLRAVQAEVLLATWFFAAGRLLEGRYHAAAASSLAITCRLNMLGAPAAGGEGLFAEGGDAVDHGERVNAFWVVYVLDKCWSVALGSSSAIGDQGSSGARISTPWPLAMAQYEQGQMVAYTGQPVVSGFLNTRTFNNVEYSPPLTLRAKAATLYSQATQLSCRYQDDMPDKQQFQLEFSRLDNLITAFINTLPHVRLVTPGDACDTVVACTVARVAVIQLHMRFAREKERSRDSCVATANAVVASLATLDVARVGFIDPIMAILLSTVCQVFVGEIKACGAVRGFSDEYVASLRATLERVLALMTDFAAVCPLMAVQVARVREAQTAA